MATSPVPQWAREMSPEHRGPTAAAVLRLAVVVVLVVLQARSTSARGHWPRPATPPPCAQHWPTTCREVPRGR